MTHAYTEEYLDGAMNNLGEAFDYVANACQIDLDDFMSLFIASGYARLFGSGNPKIVAGMSGTELAINVIERAGKKMHFPPAQIEYDYSSEYWCGWILAFYQWTTGLSFCTIFDMVSMTDVNKLYPTLHEASEEKFVDTVNALIARRTAATRLQTRRKSVGMTQSQLAQNANVNLRTLQQYESGAKDINKASVSSVRALAQVLGCQVEDILEFAYPWYSNCSKQNSCN